MIKLSSRLQITKPEDYKVHLASWNGHDHPLDVFVRDRKEWDGWNKYRKKNNRFNRPYILALIDFYPERDIWLFGGIYEVLSRNPHSYEIKRVPDDDELVGRLKIRFSRPGRANSLILENWLKKMFIEPY